MARLEPFDRGQRLGSEFAVHRQVKRALEAPHSTGGGGFGLGRFRTVSRPHGGVRGPYLVSGHRFARARGFAGDVAVKAHQRGGRARAAAQRRIGDRPCDAIDGHSPAGLELAHGRFGFGAEDAVHFDAAEGAL